MLRHLPLVAPIVAAAATFLCAPTASQAQTCRTIEVDVTPTDDLQIVMWLEDTDGNYIETVFVTALTGSYGLGNRPGRFDFNSGPLWPYGRRITTFPVWAHRHGMVFPEVGYQNNDTDNLSHPLSQSSLERFYCRPIKPNEPLWDAMTCASVVFTDKGVLSGTATSLYPPRSDLTFDAERDHESVPMMAGMNPFDSVSAATPVGGGLYTARWPIPFDLPNGDYVLFVETSKEFDQNASHDYPAPVGIPWSDYGLPYRGQPSVVYSTPVTILDGATVTMTSDYIGYGDPDGLDGDLRAPDATITTGTPGSGAGRLLLTSDGGDMFRVRARAKAEQDDILPGTPSELIAVTDSGSQATMTFIAPGDDDDVGNVAAYEVRYQAGTPITAENWNSAIELAEQIAPAEPGTIQSFTITGLIPQTNYYVGVRAIDDCLNESGIETVAFTTAAIESGEVDYCFVATAAYGSLLANDVKMLRAFRDNVLRGHVAGEMAVAGYYTFGPALAKLIAPSDTGRSVARAALAPLVDAARSLLKER